MSKTTVVKVGRRPNPDRSRNAIGYVGKVVARSLPEAAQARLAASTTGRSDPAPRPSTGPSEKANRGSTKADRLVQMLSRARGASMDELVAEFGTQPHSVRAAISIEKRKRELTVVLENGRYRLR